MGRRVNLGQNYTLSLLCFPSPCLLITSLSAPRGLLGTPRGLFETRLPLLAEIFFLCASVSPRTGTNTHLKAVSSQQITTTQARRGKQEAVRRWARHVNQVPPTPNHLHPRWSLSSRARPMEKPQVRGCIAREKKTGGSNKEVLHIGMGEGAWLVVLEEMVEGPGAGDRDRQRLGRSMLAQRVVSESLLGIFQCDDGEDGPPVHAPHAGAVTHEVVVNGGIFRAHLGENRGPR